MEEFERETPIWERKKAGEIKGELLELTRAVLKKYSLADDAKKTRYFIAQPSRMLKRELSRWNTLCLRRMKQSPNTRNPWRINFSRNIPFEVFDVLKVLCETTSATKKETKCRCKFTFTLAEDIMELMEKAGLKSQTESSVLLSKHFKNKYHASLNCREDRPLEITYSYSKETITLSCFYGVWNAFGIPQHV